MNPPFQGFHRKAPKEMEGRMTYAIITITILLLLAGLYACLKVAALADKHSEKQMDDKKEKED